MNAKQVIAAITLSGTAAAGLAQVIDLDPYIPGLQPTQAEVKPDKTQPQAIRPAPNVESARRDSVTSANERNKGRTELSVAAKPRTAQ